MIRFLTIQNRQGKVRLAKYYVPYTELEKQQLVANVHRLMVPRDQRSQSNFVEYQNHKLVYRRYAGLFFCACIDMDDNELAYLEAIHLFVEILDAYFANVCELDFVFHFYKVYAVLDEIFLAGEIQETSKSEILARLEQPVKEFQTPYPPIDTDPHFRRVVNYFRPSDYTVWASTAAAFPGALFLLEQADPTRPRRGLGTSLRLSAFLGVVGGFLFAYQRSSFRFWGWTENEREQQHAQEEAASGKYPGVGESALSPDMQGAAFRNSVFSQLNFAVLPWFNVVNHPYHEPRKSE